MRNSLATSTAIHALILGWGLFSLSGPQTLDAGVVETLPVDIVPISEMTQIQQGERTAPLAESASPEPTEERAPEPDAQNIGNNTVDLDTPPTPDARPEAVEEAAAPAAAEEPQPVPTPEPEPEPEPVEAAEPEPAPEPEPEPVEPAPSEMAALPEPQAIEEPAEANEPLPESETPEAVAPSEPENAVPENVPTPMARPEPPRPEPEPEPEPERPEPEPQQPTQAAEASSAKESEFDADEIAALLNQEQASGGGQRQSEDQAALGGRTTTGGESLSQSEIDALRAQIQRCWSIIPGMADGADVRVRVSMRLSPDGSIDGQPSVSASGGSQAAQNALSGGALRAVLRCAPYQLPAEKYATWSDVVVNFDPSQMF
ncbi:cell envelope integrity protein TolA [Pararhizobium haloflavum]|uniref:cell envelope integrity protein TolA n=1 Tax=Pararhizobium haloflavum TaxID=2037914 RepID=UPI000C18CE70|nr:cell envelope integrity protein TolA [Pararhizobium haloflavum]